MLIQWKYFLVMPQQKNAWQIYQQDVLQIAYDM